MKKHQTLYIAGALLLVVGGYMYMKKANANKTTLPPVEESTTSSDTTTPSSTPSSTGNTLGGASQVIDSIKGLLAEIKNKSTTAVKTITPIV